MKKKETRAPDHSRVDKVNGAGHHGVEEEEEEEEDDAEEEEEEENSKSASSGTGAGKGNSKSAETNDGNAVSRMIMENGVARRRRLCSRDKPLVKDLNPVFVCPLCQGYLVDATTLAECPHSFCHGCLQKKLKSGGPRRCPVCDTAIETPATADPGLQRLVYLAVPGLFRAEQDRRKRFHENDLEQAKEQRKQRPQEPLGAPVLTFDDMVSLSIAELDLSRGSFRVSENSTRYLKCPAGVTVRHLVRLMMLKRGWDSAEGNISPTNRLEMLYSDGENVESQTELKVLDPAWTLLDLACIFGWKAEFPMRLVYRIVKVEESPPVKPEHNKPAEVTSNQTNVVPSNETPSNEIPNNETPSNDSPSTNNPVNGIANNGNHVNQAMENIQRPLTPPPSPKPQISKHQSVDKHQPNNNSNKRPPPAPIEAPKDNEVKKPRCEVTPVLRAPDPPVNLPHIPTGLEIRPVKSSKSGKPEHHKHRKHRQKKRLIGEITRTADAEDMLKLRVRLTPVPVRSSHAKSSLPHHGRSVRKDKDRSPGRTSLRPGSPSPGPGPPSSSGDKDKPAEASRDESPQTTKAPEPPVAGSEPPAVAPAQKPPQQQSPPAAEPAKDAEVLRRLGLVGIDEANRALQERLRNAPGAALNREKLEKQLRESKANRVKSLLAEKQMRDTIKSIMSNSRDDLTITPATRPPRPGTVPATSPPRAPTPSANAKKKEPPALTPLKQHQLSAGKQRPTVTFAPAPPQSPPGKTDSPLDLSSAYGKNSRAHLDLCTESSAASSSSKAALARKLAKERHPVGILRTHHHHHQVIPPLFPKFVPEVGKPKLVVERKANQELNLRTLSDAAVSLMDDRSQAKKILAGQGSSSGGPTGLGFKYGNSATSPGNVGGKFALRIPQPPQQHHYHPSQQRLGGFGEVKMKPNQGVRHIPNPQAVVASNQFRNSQNRPSPGYYGLTHQPP